MKSWIVHYQNKYPGGRVQMSESALDVWDKNGDHVVAMRKNGAGQWNCESEAHGCKDAHDLAPIPRSARVKKLSVDGKIIEDDQAEERKKACEEFLCDEGRKIHSMAHLKKEEGYEFSAKGEVEKRPSVE